MITSADIFMPEIEVYDEDADRVDKDISDCAFPKRDKCLMVLIGGSIEHGNNSRYCKRSPRNHTSSKSAKKENGENCIFSNMSPFLYKHIKGAKV